MALPIQTSLGPINLDGPHSSTANISEESGLYLISTIAQNGRHNVLDVGESHRLKTRLNNHDRATQWVRHQINGLYVSVLYCNEATRMLLERELRAAFNPPCGVR